MKNNIYQVLTTTASKYQWHDIEGFRYKNIKSQTVLIGNVWGLTVWPQPLLLMKLIRQSYDAPVSWSTKSWSVCHLGPKKNMENLIEIAVLIWAPHILFILIESAVIIWVPHIPFIRVWKWGFNHDLSTAYQLNVARAYWCPNMKLKQR